jgi:hypothetical protein
MGEKVQDMIPKMTTGPNLDLISNYGDTLMSYDKPELRLIGATIKQLAAEGRPFVQQAKELIRLMMKLRTFFLEEVEVLLDCYCVGEDSTPDRSTMEPDDARHVGRVEEMLHEIEKLIYSGGNSPLRLDEERPPAPG